jgi:hypothetical protein
VGIPPLLFNYAHAPCSLHDGGVRTCLDLHAAAGELDRKLSAIGAMAASISCSSQWRRTSKSVRATTIWRIVHTIYIFVNTIYREEVPCVVRRCGRGHDGTFLFARAYPHVSNSWWGILQTSAASLNVPEAYFTCEPPASPMIFLTVEGPRCP